MGASTRVLFLDAADDVLVRRYEATRRKHPLADRRARLRRHRQRARSCSRSSRAGPTSSSTPPTSTCTSCATGSRELFDDDQRAGALQTSIVSFGYKHGLPIDVDLVFDCRFLPNPHWVDELRPLRGHRSARPRLRAAAARDRRRSSTSCERLVRAAAPGVRARGQVVPLDRRRLHRRSPPQRGDRDRARTPPRVARRLTATSTTATSIAWADVTPARSSRSAVGTGSRPRCAPSAATPARSPRS